MRCLLGTVLLAGCIVTQVVVSIDADNVQVPDEITQLLIKVTNPGAGSDVGATQYQSPSLPLCGPGQASGCSRLPLTVTLYTGAKQPDAKVRVEVDAFGAGATTPTIADASIFGFHRDATDRLDFRLYKSCLNTGCASMDRSCAFDGGCAALAPRSPPPPAPRSNRRLVVALSIVGAVVGAAATGVGLGVGLAQPRYASSDLGAKQVTP